MRARFARVCRFLSGGAVLLAALGLAIRAPWYYPAAAAGAAIALAATATWIRRTTQPTEPDHDKDQP